MKKKERREKGEAEKSKAEKSRAEQKRNVYKGIGGKSNSTVSTAERGTVSVGATVRMQARW